MVADPAASALGPFAEAAAEGVAEELSPRPDSSELRTPCTSTNTVCHSHVQSCLPACVGNPRYSSSILNLGHESTKNPCPSELRKMVSSVSPSQGSAWSTPLLLRLGEVLPLLLGLSVLESSPSHGGAFPTSHARSPRATIALDVSIGTARAPVSRRPPSPGVLVVRSLVLHPPGAGAP